MRRSFGRTRLGDYIKRVSDRVPRGEERSIVVRSSSGRNVLLVSHCDFTGNSAYHVHSLARALSDRGWPVAVAVPGSVRGAHELGEVDFPIVSYRELRRTPAPFPDARPPSIVHAFTPRTAVRALTREMGVPYVVHLEDNESIVRSALRGESDGEAQDAFVSGARAVTAVIERLLELKPHSVPGFVAHPGYDETLDMTGRSRDEVRRELGLPADVALLVYTGNVHAANADEVGELYRAVAGLRADGENITIVRTGWSSVSRSRLPTLGRGLVELGWVRRRRVLELIRAADVLVQPGAPGPFNDYRFPSKLPDYLASGNPVILPRTNVGLALEHGEEAVLLERGSASEIEGAVRRLLADAELRARIGARGRAFARRALRWTLAAEAVESAYSGALGRSEG